MKKKAVYLIIVAIFVVSIFSFGKEKEFTIKSVSYNGENLKLSIDGVESKTLPTEGFYYLADYDCESVNTKLSWDSNNYELSVSNGDKSSGIACYLKFESQPKLSSMSEGSYVKYIGNNGCVGNSCGGSNANYVDDDNMGYCGNENYKFITNGWRIGYIEDDSAYLVSAGATDCMCTDSSGRSSNNCSSSLSGTNIKKHIDNMNDIANKYCNSNYASGGVCDNTTLWAMNNKDFKKITGNTLDTNSCNGKYSDKSCGYTNDLIDNGGYYRFATTYNDYSEMIYYWRSDYRGLFSSDSSYSYGVRPVIKLDSSVVVVGGKGTYDDPYLIDNNSFLVNGGDYYITERNNVELKLSGSNEVSNMCISVGSSGCDNYVEFSNTYTLDLSGEDNGEATVYVYYKNKDGNVIASLRQDIVIDIEGPINNSIEISEGDSLTRKLILSSDGADYMCFSNASDNKDNCTNWVKYSRSYNWKLSDGDGNKIVYAFFKDKAGNVSRVVSDTISYSRNCLEVNDIYNISYSGKVVNSNNTDVKFCSGIYKLETWGAQGGNSGGKGGYASGNITLTGDETLYFYVGGAGGKGTNAGFNGGGTTGSSGGAGGGATDIRINTDSLYARVIVAGGGGGNGKDNCAIGGFGGGATGGGSTNQNSCGIQAGSGNQTLGGNAGTYNNISGANSGTFGFGGNALDGIYDGGAGGGGWYGGGAGASADWSNGGGGGSGFIFNSSSVLPFGHLLNSTYYLEDAIMIDGNSSMPTTDGNSKEFGHTSNGHIKITRLS